jgi:hypothetical protein
MATYAWQAFQVSWRGVAYTDRMTDWLASVSPGLIDSMNLAFVSGLSPFSLLTWQPTIGRFTTTIAGFIALLCWLTLLGPRLPSPDEISGGTRFKIDNQAAFAGFLLATISPLALTYTAWLVSGSAAVQPRYYMATAMTLGCIGIASTSSIYLRTMAVSVLGISALTSIWTLIAI